MDAQKMVDFEVGSCITDLVDGSDCIDLDRFANDKYYLCPDCEEEITCDTLKELRCPHCGCELSEVEEFNGETYYKDILEYWIVSPWLGKQLKAHGEPIYERHLGWIWGRTTSGQAICLDDVMEEIANGK